MRTQFHSPPSRRGMARRQRGAAIVEFALVAMIFLTLLIGIVEFGRWLFTLNTASEATRLGARWAVVCSVSDADKIKDRMRYYMSGVSREQIRIDYRPAACDPSWTAETNACESVAVGLSGVTFTPMIPLMNAAVSVPSFTTTLPREYMQSTGNPVCPP